MTPGQRGPNKPRAVTSVPDLRSKASGIFRYPAIRVQRFSKSIRILQTVVSPRGRVPVISLEGCFDHGKIVELIRERKASLFELPQKYAGEEVGVVLHLNNPNYPANYDLALVFSSKEEGFSLIAFLEKDDMRANQCIFTPESARFKGRVFPEACFCLVEDKSNNQKYFDLRFPSGETDFDFIRHSCPHLLPVLEQATEDMAFGEVYFRFLVLPNGKIGSAKIGDRRGAVCDLAVNEQFPFDFLKTGQLLDSAGASKEGKKGIDNSTVAMPVEIKFGLIHMGAIREFLAQGDGKSAFKLWEKRSKSLKHKILLNLSDEDLNRWFDLLWENPDSKEMALELLINLELNEMLDFVCQYKTAGRSEADLLLKMLGKSKQKLQKWRYQLDIDNINVRQIIAFLMILPASETNMASLLLADAELPREEELRVVNEMKDKFPLLKIMFGSIIEEFDNDEF